MYACAQITPPCALVMPTHALCHNSLQHVSPATIYHMTVMPCYDKKLEASRSDFFDPKQQSRDVDCVITTGGFFGGHCSWDSCHPSCLWLWEGHRSWVSLGVLSANVYLLCQREDGGASPEGLAEWPLLGLLSSKGLRQKLGGGPCSDLCISSSTRGADTLPHPQAPWCALVSEVPYVACGQACLVAGVSPPHMLRPGKGQSDPLTTQGAQPTAALCCPLQERWLGCWRKRGCHCLPWSRPHWTMCESLVKVPSTSLLLGPHMPGLVRGQFLAAIQEREQPCPTDPGPPACPSPGTMTQVFRRPPAIGVGAQGATWSTCSGMQPVSSLAFM